MRFQKTCYSCGAASIVNALKCFGRNVDERKIRSLASTTAEDGTDDEGILTALDILGFNSTVFSSEKRRESLMLLKASLDEGMPVIIVSDSDTHWMTVVGRLGNKFLVFDPQRTIRNIKENGISVLGERELFRRWNVGSSGHYGIAVKKKRKTKE